MNTVILKKGLGPFLIFIFFNLSPSYSQSTEKFTNINFKNKLFVKAGVGSDYDVYPA